MDHWGREKIYIKKINAASLDKLLGHTQLIFATKLHFSYDGLLQFTGTSHDAFALQPGKWMHQLRNISPVCYN